MIFRKPEQFGQQEESPIIELPDDQELRQVLENKLAEYNERLKKNPYLSPESPEILDTKHKIAVLEKLLKDGSVNTYNFSKELSEARDFVFDASFFNNACAVIEDYVKTGGRRTRGGTGLNKSN
ncbi:MAG: hypothetical protein WC705_03005 [Candidatus Paceibacterota bacterium]|jgi:hypothetical protein